VRQQRRWLRAHVDKDKPAEFLGLVGADATLIAEVVLRVRGVLERLLKRSGHSRRISSRDTGTDAAFSTTP